MWLLNKISCEIQILNEKVGKLMIENGELREENRKLKESLDIATKCSSKEEDGIIRLSEENKTLKANIEFLHSCLDDRDKSIAIMQEENKKLKEELEWYKKQYEHSMGEDTQYTHGEPVVSSGPCL